jgi:hypothetical protein
MICGEVLSRVKYLSSPALYFQLFHWGLTALYSLAPLAAARLCSTQTGPISKGKNFFSFPKLRPTLGHTKHLILQRVSDDISSGVKRHLVLRVRIRGAVVHPPHACIACTATRRILKFRFLKKTTIRCFEMSRPDYPVISQNGKIFRHTAGKTSKFAYIDFWMDKILLTMTFRGLNSRDAMLNQYVKHCGLTMALLPVGAFLTIRPHQLKKTHSNVHRYGPV